VFEGGRVICRAFYMCQDLVHEFRFAVSWDLIPGVCSRLRFRRSWCSVLSY
jgi:hypothetical protein